MHEHSNPESIFSQPVVDFVEQRLTLLKRNFWNPDVPRFAHCDLALWRQRAGHWYVKGFKSVSSTRSNRPTCRKSGWMCVLEVKPPR